MAKGGDRKYGRNKARCAAYRLSNRREINKVRKLYQHLRKGERHGLPEDPAARASYEKHKALIPHKYRDLYRV